MRLAARQVASCKLCSLPLLSGRGAVRSISFKWNALGMGVIWRAVDLSK